MSLSVSPLVAPFEPSNPSAMPALANHDSPAYLAAQRFRRGVSLGCYLEALPDWEQVTCPPEEFAIMRAEGFDHVRVPVRWQIYAGAAPAHALEPEIFARVDYVVEHALANGLSVIVNAQHFDEFNQNPTARANQLLALWQQIAERYQRASSRLAFEILNEPNDVARTELLNPIYGRVLARIRESNPDRTLFVQPGNWGRISELRHLVLPQDNNLIVSVHCYEPFYFTHQGASWAGEDGQMTGLAFPGPPSVPLSPDARLRLKPPVRQWLQKYNTLPAEINPCSVEAFNDLLKYACQWSEHYGYPVHVGEFGCYAEVAAAARANYLTAFRRELDRQKLGWAMWSWSGNFGYWDQAAGEPMPGLRSALFG